MCAVVGPTYHVEVARDEREAAQVEEVELREHAHLQVGGQVAQEAQLPAAQAQHVLARLLAEHAPDLICAHTSSENRVNAVSYSKTMNTNVKN